MNSARLRPSAPAARCARSRSRCERPPRLRRGSRRCPARTHRDAGARPCAAPSVQRAWPVIQSCSPALIWSSAAAASDGQQVSVPVIGRTDLGRRIARPAADTRNVVLADPVLGDNVLEWLVDCGRLPWQVHLRDHSMKARIGSPLEGVGLPLAMQRRGPITSATGCVLGRSGYHAWPSGPFGGPEWAGRAAHRPTDATIRPVIDLLTR